MSVSLWGLLKTIILKSVRLLARAVVYLSSLKAGEPLTLFQGLSGQSTDSDGEENVDHLFDLLSITPSN